ncbi:MAG TPA: metallophosphoesterase family protein [Xanthobacteraceae bacterium]|nr:metallophosphoesterase family protein [Xanthobacteraceae bacterium]
MWKSRASRKKNLEARVPDGIRVYAVGDVHGRADLLDQVFERIDADLAAVPAPQAIQVMLGDYIDRGPSSRAVLDRLIARGRGRHLVCLKGNHEIFVADFLADPALLEEWRRFGGLETLMSYGLTPSMKGGAAEQASLAAALEQALPAEHREFLVALSPSFACGDFFFVHAGVRPRVPLERQAEHDLLWIREDFLLHEDEFEKVVVHGHTPVEQPDIRPNRINIDTGAFATGRLTCLRIEAGELTFI